MRQGVFSQQRVNAIKKVYEHGVCGRNSHKHRVIVDRVGNLRVQDLGRVFEDDELVGYTMQRLLELSEEILEEQEQVIWIVDLGGKIMQLAGKRNLEWVSRIVTLAQRFFPLMLYRY